MKNLVIARQLLALADHLLTAEQPPPLPGKAPAAPAPAAPGAPAATPPPAAQKPPSLPAAQEKQRMDKVSKMVKEELPLVLKEVLPVKMDPAKKDEAANKIAHEVGVQLMEIKADLAQQLVTLAQQLIDQE